MTNAQQQYNQQLAQTITDLATGYVAGQIQKEKAANGFSVETYYTITNPFATGTPEQAYYTELIENGTATDPRYVDLFGRVMRMVTDELKKEGVKPFVTLNCRFDAEKEDNFLFYVFASWAEK